MNAFRIAGIVLVAVDALLCTGFIIDYSRLSSGRWRRYAEGSMLVGLTGSLGAVLYFVLAGRILGDSWLRQVIGLVLFASLTPVLCWLWWLMRRSQQRSRLDRTEGGASDGA